MATERILLRFLTERSTQGNYGNHSCDPNTDKNRVALRDIDAGEELTADYAQFSTKDWEMTCNCGAKNCKGIVRGAL
jgi:SET domain-containing protein